MLGIYVSDHPLREIEEAVRAAADCSLGELDELGTGKICWFAGMLGSVTRKPTKKGAMMAIVVLEDLDGAVEAVLFPQTYEKYRDLIVEDTVLRMKAKVEVDDRGRKLIVAEIEPFDGATFAKAPKKIVVKADGSALVNGRAAALKRILTNFPGRDIVELHVWDAAKNKTIVCAMPERVNASANGLHAELMEIFGLGAIEGAA
jgi:DNA polymerase-3 subunit alpha